MHFLISTAIINNNLCFVFLFHFFSNPAFSEKLIIFALPELFADGWTQDGLAGVYWSGSKQEMRRSAKSSQLHAGVG